MPARSSSAVPWRQHSCRRSTGALVASSASAAAHLCVDDRDRRPASQLLSAAPLATRTRDQVGRPRGESAVTRRHTLRRRAPTAALRTRALRKPPGVLPPYPRSQGERGGAAPLLGVDTCFR